MSVLVRVRVKVRISFRLATFMYSVWPPVSLRVRVSLGMSSCTPFSLCQTPKIIASLFNLPPNLYCV